MTHRDLDNGAVRNPDDPWHREWGAGSVMATIVVLVIMAGIIAYGASAGTQTPTAPNSTALHHSATGRSHAGT